MKNGTTLHKHRSRRGQSMLEFALALPVLLLIVFGIIEFGRLLLVYSSVFAASREAARYGASVDATDNGPRYQDCAGMRAAAVRAGVFAGITPGNVEIHYDSGQYTPDQSFYGLPTCTGSSSGYNAQLGDRIIVQVSVPYRPIVAYGPLMGIFLDQNGNFRQISNIVARTIILDVYMEDTLPTPPPERTATPNPPITNTPPGPTRTPTRTSTPTRTLPPTNTPPPTRTPTPTQVPTCESITFLQAVLYSVRNTYYVVIIVNNTSGTDWNLGEIAVAGGSNLSMTYADWDTNRIWSRSGNQNVTQVIVNGVININAGSTHTLKVGLEPNLNAYSSTTITLYRPNDPMLLCQLTEIKR